jgi:hypothetical protein
VPVVLLPADISYLRVSLTAVLHPCDVTARQITVCDHVRRGVVVLSRPRTVNIFYGTCSKHLIIFKEIHSRARGDFGQQNFIKMFTYHDCHSTYYNKRILEEFDKKENREGAEVVIKKP